jgi:RiboL-PSP-HEPN
MIEANFRSRMSAISYYLRSLRELEERHKVAGKGFYRAAQTLAASRASAFIMIYNCVEFATRETVTSVRKHMQSNAVDYCDIAPFWQLEILQAHFKQKLEDGVNHTHLLQEFREFIPGQVNWLLRQDAVPFSGNIDHLRLIKFAKDIGATRWRPPGSTLGGSDLLTIRTTRNELAHGDETFEDVGANYSVSDITDKLQRIRTFMCSYIKMMERYANSTSYRIN